MDPAELRDCLMDAGFHVTATTDLERKRLVSSGSDGQERFAMRVFVARPSSS